MNWHIIACTGGQEATAKAVLDALGIVEVWWPTKKRQMSEAAYQRCIRRYNASNPTAQTPKPVRYQIEPWVKGYVFAYADSLACHIINGTHGMARNRETDTGRRAKFSHASVHLNVITINGTPYRVPESQMAQMKDIPERAQQIVADAKQAEWAAREAIRPIVGGRAIVHKAPFAGIEAEVVALAMNGVTLDFGGTLGHVTMPIGAVERVE